MPALLTGSTIRRAIGTVRTEARSTITAIPIIAKSLPTQSKPAPSPTQKTPKEEISIPTTNLRLFSGTLASGRWTIKPRRITTTPAAAAPKLAGINIPPVAPRATTMNTTSNPSSTTALNVAPAPPRSIPSVIEAREPASEAVSFANSLLSSWRARIPAERRIALRSQRMPNSSSNTPTASRRVSRGTKRSSGPKAKTSIASNTPPAAAPARAERAPRTVHTARTIVRASTNSTNEARNDASTVGPSSFQTFISLPQRPRAEQGVLLARWIQPVQYPHKGCRSARSLSLEHIVTPRGVLR